MTNYNDGKWHGWNDGECPVHPKTWVEVCGVEWSGEEVADVFDWEEGAGDPIVAFRVIEGYKEPRVLWALILDNTVVYSTTDESQVKDGVGEWGAVGVTLHKFVEEKT
jgi:hypothetical protein